MSALYRWFTVPVLIALTGCAQMAVRVEILNTGYWATPDYIDSITVTQIAESVQRIRDGRFDVDRAALKRKAAETVAKMAVGPNAVVASQQVDRLTRNLAKTIDDAFQGAKKEFEFAFGNVRGTAAASTQEDRARLMREAGASFGSGAAIIAGLAHQLSSQFAIPSSEPTPAPLRQLEDKTKSVAEGLIGNAGILDDPRASAVVYAPDRFWERRFNDTFCAGNFGNTDCAVKMEGLGSFTLKGVRLDATKITQATFSVAREAIQTVAAVYGVPVPRSTSAAGAQATDGGAASLDMQSPVKRQRDAATSLLQLRLARLAILEAIAGQRAAVTGSDQMTRDQAIAAIKAVFQANKPQLDSPAIP